MHILMGRPRKNRVKASLMIDQRLWDRVLVAAEKKGVSRSDAVNGMMWAGILGRMNVVEKEEFSAAIDKFAEFAKSWAEHGL